MEPDIGSESRFLPAPPAFDAPVTGFPSEYSHDVWCGKTRMAAHGEKNLTTRVLVLTESTIVTDGHTHTERETPHDGIGRAAKINF